MATDSFGQRVKRARQTVGITQGELGRRLGKKTGDGYVTHLENDKGRGKNPSDELIEGLRVALGVSPDYLRTGRLPMLEGAAAAGAPRRTLEKETVELYPSRRQAVIAAREAKRSEAAISMALEERKSDGVDPGLQFWLDLIFRFEQEIVREKGRALPSASDVGDVLQTEHERKRK